MKKTAPRISDQAAEFLPDVFRSLNSGCEDVINSFPHLFRKTVLEIKEIFEPNELKLIIDIHTAYMVTPIYAGQGLIAQCEDSISLDGTDEKWGIDKDSFLQKIRNLTAYQAATIDFWATGFWYAQTTPPDAIKSIETYIK